MAVSSRAESIVPDSIDVHRTTRVARPAVATAIMCFLRMKQSTVDTMAGSTDTRTYAPVSFR